MGRIMEGTDMTPPAGAADCAAPDSAGPEPAAPRAGDAAEDARRRARARRRLDAVFGEVLPMVTGDERAPGEHGGFDAAHYRRERPPHHVAR